MEEREEKERLLCSVCNQEYKFPRSLPCFHTFCENCIISEWSVLDNEENVQRSAKCPVCDFDILAPNSNIAVQEWVRSFPRNVLLESLVIANYDRSSKCDPCARVDEANDAVFHCKDCRENLCEKCYSYMHQRIACFQKHAVSKNPVSRECLDLNENCAVHPNEILENFCVAHQLPCCKICMATEHKTCSEVRPVDEIPESSNILENLQPVLERVNSAVFPIKKELEDHNKKHSDFWNTASSTVDTILSKIQEMHKDFNTKLQATQDQQLLHLSSTRKYLEAFLYTLTAAENLLTFVSKRGTRRQMFVTASKVKFQIQKQLKRLEELHGKQSEFSCQINEKVYKLSEIEYIAKLNEIDVDLSKVSAIEDEIKTFETKMRIDDPLSPESTVDPAKLTVKLVAQYAEEMPSMRDGCLLSDGTPIVISYGEVRMFRDGKTTTLIDLGTDDRQYVFDRICSGERDQIFIKTTEEKIREYALHENELQHVRSISFDISFEAFRYLGNKFYCKPHASSYETGLAILNENGKLLRIVGGPNRSGEDVALSLDGQCVYYSNCKDIYGKDLTGTPPFFKYSPQDEQSYYSSYKIYRGLDVDRHGNVYASEKEKNGNYIIQISKGGTEAREFLEIDDNIWVESIKFDYAKARLAIFCNSMVYGEDTQVIKVYEIIVDDIGNEECVATDDDNDAGDDKDEDESELH